MLEPRDTLALVAPEGSPWTESWTVTCGEASTPRRYTTPARSPGRSTTASARASGPGTRAERSGSEVRRPETAILDALKRQVTRHTDRPITRHMELAASALLLSVTLLAPSPQSVQHTEALEKMERLMNIYAVAGWKFIVRPSQDACVITIRQTANSDHICHIPLAQMDPTSVNWNLPNDDYNVDCTGDYACIRNVDQANGEVTADVTFANVLDRKAPAWVRRTWGEIMVKLVTDCGGKTDAMIAARRNLELSIGRCHPQDIRNAITAGADPNGSRFFMIHALDKCGMDVVQTLLTAGANPQPDPDASPLHFVGDVAVAELFLARGVEVDARDDVGRTPLLKAASAGREKIVRLFLAKGANPNARSKYSDTVLHEAVRSESGEVVTLLLQAGAAVNARDDHGQTPLHMVRTPEVARVLLAGGADQTMKRVKGETPRELIFSRLQKYTTGEWVGAESWERLDATYKVLDAAYISRIPPTVQPVEPAQPAPLTQPPPLQSRGCRISGTGPSGGAPVGILGCAWLMVRRRYRYR